MIGNIGYLFCLVDHYDVYVAKKIDPIKIPTNVKGMVEFKQTLRLLFAYKVLVKKRKALAHENTTGIYFEHWSYGRTCT
jgi:hypothetical protein